MKNSIILLLILVLTLSLFACSEDQASDVAGSLSTGSDMKSKQNKRYPAHNQQLGYAFGVQFAKGVESNDLVKEVDLDAVLAGIKDVFSKAELALTPEQMRLAVEKLSEKKQEEAKVVGVANKIKSDEFINAKKDEVGIKATKSGVLYKAIKTSGGGASPKADSSVRVHYKGTLIDGTVFDSSYFREEVSQVSMTNLVPGLRDGLLTMKVGEKSIFYIPANLGYGTQAPSTVGQNQALIFEVELLGVQ